MLTTTTRVIHTRSIKSKLLPGLPVTPTRICSIPLSPSRLYAYYNNQMFDEWVKYYSSTNLDQSPDLFLNYIFQRGNQFEDDILKLIKRKGFPVKKICNGYGFNTIRQMSHLTEKCMRSGCPIIHSAPLYSKKRNFFGIADLLINGFTLKKLFPHLVNCLNEDEAIFGNYYYAIDIKSSSVQLLSNKYLGNTGKTNYYKSQVYMYSLIISDIQNIEPTLGFLLCNKYKSCKVNYSPFERLGVINFQDHDNYIIPKFMKAVNYMRLFIRDGHLWNVDEDPTNQLLLPNDGSKGNCQGYKKAVLQRTGDITQLYRCGLKHRQMCFNKGIISINDPNISSENLGICNSKYQKIVDKMIELHQQNREIIYPNKITNVSNEWRNEDNAIYLDFETINNIFKGVERSGLIFNVGFCYQKKTKLKTKLKTKSYVVKELNDESEKQLLLRMIKKIQSISSNPVIYYYCADESMFNKSMNYHNIEIPDWKWIDVHKIFVNEPIVIKDCFNYKLKNVANYLYKYNKISSNLTDSIVNCGSNAMVLAYNYYTNKNNSNTEYMHRIIKYNEFDCKVLFEIISYLRKNH